VRPSTPSQRILAANRAFASYLVATNECENAEQVWQKVAAQSTDGSGILSLADYYVWSGRPDDALSVLSRVSNADDNGGAAGAGWPQSSTTAEIARRRRALSTSCSSTSSRASTVCC
jgi:hypothetical protein